MSVSRWLPLLLAGAMSCGCTTIERGPSRPVADHTSSGTVTANRIRIAYQSDGDPQGPAILLIMGTAGQLIDWPAALCTELVQRGFRVIRFDHRDAGLSAGFDEAGPPDWAAVFASIGTTTRPPLPYTLDDMASDSVGLLDALGVARAHLVGVSMGE